MYILIIQYRTKINKQLLDVKTSIVIIANIAQERPDIAYYYNTIESKTSHIKLYTTVKQLQIQMSTNIRIRYRTKR